MLRKPQTILGAKGCNAIPSVENNLVYTDRLRGKSWHLCLCIALTCGRSALEMRLDLGWLRTFAVPDARVRYAGACTAMGVRFGSEPKTMLIRTAVRHRCRHRPLPDTRPRHQRAQPRPVALLSNRRTPARVFVIPVRCQLRRREPGPNNGHDSLGVL